MFFFAFTLGFALAFTLAFFFAFTLGFALAFALGFPLAFFYAFTLGFALAFALGFPLAFFFEFALRFAFGFPLAFFFAFTLGFALGFPLALFFEFVLGFPFAFAFAFKFKTAGRSPVRFIPAARRDMFIIIICHINISPKIFGRPASISYVNEKETVTYITMQRVKQSRKFYDEVCKRHINFCYKRYSQLKAEITVFKLYKRLNSNSLIKLHFPRKTSDELRGRKHYLIKRTGPAAENRRNEIIIFVTVTVALAVYIAIAVTVTIFVAIASAEAIIKLIIASARAIETGIVSAAIIIAPIPTSDGFSAAANNIAVIITASHINISPKIFGRPAIISYETEVKTDTSHPPAF